MRVLVTVVFAASLAIGSTVGAAECCDDMETPLWSTGHENPGYDGTWIARYDTARYHSPVQSIRTSLHGGGYVGLDSDRAYAS
jgi:hypothetical protein